MDCVSNHRVNCQQAPHGRAAATEFFIKQAKRDHVETETTTLFRQSSPQVSAAGQFLDHFDWRAFTFIVADRARDDLFIDEGPELVTVFFLSRSQFDLHWPASSSTSSRR